MKPGPATRAIDSALEARGADEGKRKMLLDRELAFADTLEAGK